MADFAAMIDKERERLGKMREDALSRRSAIDTEIAAIDKELRAITAYESAKSDSPRKGKGTGARRNSRQDGILSLLKAAPHGLGRRDLLDKLGLKGNKSGEQSISNALNNMKKAGRISSKDGKYLVA